MFGLGVQSQKQLQSKGTHTRRESGCHLVTLGQSKDARPATGQAAYAAQANCSGPSWLLLDDEHRPVTVHHGEGQVHAHLMCVRPHRNPKYPGQPKVSKLHNGLTNIDQDVLRLEISMDNPGEREISSQTCFSTDARHCGDASDALPTAFVVVPYLRLWM